jgi:hypothetical protein
MKSKMIVIVLLYFLTPFYIYASGECMKNPCDHTSYKSTSTLDLIESLTTKCANIYFDQGINSESYLYDIGTELTERKDVKLMLEIFDHSKDEGQKQVLMLALTNIDDENIYQELKVRMTQKTDRSMYYCIYYVAKRGDQQALKLLNDNYNKYVSSWEWAEAVLLFGKYNYKPSIPNLIESLDAASLNLVGAAHNSLEKLFNGPHPDFKTIGETKLYFENLYKKSLTNQ